MAEIDKEEIRHIAKLARLGLDEAEIDTFTNQIQETLGYIDLLQEVDTSQVEETSQVTGLNNMCRADELDSDWFERADLLEASPLPVIDDQIVVKKVFDNE